jgi:hypothetical protein
VNSLPQRKPTNPNEEEAFGVAPLPGFSSVVSKSFLIASRGSSAVPNWSYIPQSNGRNSKRGTIGIFFILRDAGEGFALFIRSVWLISSTTTRLFQSPFLIASGGSSAVLN